MTDFLKASSLVAGAAAEALNPTPWSTGAEGDRADPFVLLSRYCDYIYVAVANVPADILPHLRYSISVFLCLIYNIPLKWEAHGSEVVWGETALTLSSKKQRLCMNRKGVCFSLSLTENLVNSEWSRWVDPDSPNAKLLWRSLLPSLVAKSLCYAGDAADFVANCRSLIWGMAIRGYPTHWWSSLFCRLYDKHILSGFFPRSQVAEWCRQRKALRQSYESPHGGRGKPHQGMR